VWGRGVGGSNGQSVPCRSGVHITVHGSTLGTDATLLGSYFIQIKTEIAQNVCKNI